MCYFAQLFKPKSSRRFSLFLNKFIRYLYLILNRKWKNRLLPCFLLLSWLSLVKYLMSLVQSPILDLINNPIQFLTLILINILDYGMNRQSYPSIFNVIASKQLLNILRDKMEALELIIGVWGMEKWWKVLEKQSHKIQLMLNWKCNLFRLWTLEVNIGL